MLVGFSPFRVSLLGGGTDIQSYYEKFGCRILGLAVNYGCLVTLNTSALHSRSSNFRLIYSEIETADNVEAIRHPLIREYFKYYNISSAELHFNADLPSISGLGTSSAFANTLTGIFSYAAGKLKSGEEIARETIWMERKKLCEAGGIQDQIISALGGLCEINADIHGWTASKYKCDQAFLKTLIQSLVLVKVGWSSTHSRNAATIESTKMMSADSLALTHEIRRLTDDGFLAFDNTDINLLGKIVDQIWKLKRQMPGVVSDEIGECYDYLKSKGAYGCRLLGAGGRGFMLGIGSPEFVSTVISDLGRSEATTVGICSSGTTIWET